ncbi:YibE/F family protein [Nocardioides sp. BGMRC 2183]|nr:YibE/F family protein [Nocardioides sp. BGMRC 2183]
MWPPQDFRDDTISSADEVTGTVTSIDQERCAEQLPDDVNGCGSATVRLDDGEEVEAPLPNGSGAPRIAEGDDVVLVISESPGGTTYGIVDHQRGLGLAVLVLAFVLAILAFGRWRGLTALVGLGVTFVVLLLFVVPAILDGESPVVVAIVGSSAIVLSVLYLTHGFSLTTTLAVLGTLASLVLTGLLAAAATAGLHLTGITDDISTSVENSYGVDMAGLLLAGIIIGSLGVLDDVTVTQAVTVAELAEAHREYRPRQVYAAAIRIGRSHIGSVVNTIVLAYAGASLPLLVLTIASNDSLGSMVTDQYLAQEIVRSVVATIGLIAAVPITTGLAAVALRSRTAPPPARRSPTTE